LLSSKPLHEKRKDLGHESVPYSQLTNSSSQECYQPFSEEVSTIPAGRDNEGVIEAPVEAGEAIEEEEMFDMFASQQKKKKKKREREHEHVARDKSESLQLQTIFVLHD
jgi:hypothetical protein